MKYREHNCFIGEIKGRKDNYSPINITIASPHPLYAVKTLHFTDSVTWSTDSSKLFQMVNSKKYC